MLALETQFSALRLWRAADLDRWKLTPGNRNVANKIRHNLSKALPYAWTKDIAQAVLLASRTIPDSTKLSWASLPRVLDAPMWWWFNAALPWRCKPSKSEEEIPVQGLLLHVHDGANYDEHGNEIDVDGEPYLTVALHGDTPQGVRFLIGFNWSFEETIAHEVQEQLTEDGEKTDADKTARLREEVSRFLCAAFVWLEQRICQLSSGHIERHRRKQLMRENKQPIASDVKVIQLRRVEAASTASAKDSDPVEWSCRWVVNGHWRNQAYANGEHKLIYIMPYVKGPDDKPLRVPKHTVYSVSR